MYILMDLELYKLKVFWAEIKLVKHFKKCLDTFKCSNHDKTTWPFNVLQKKVQITFYFI